MTDFSNKYLLCRANELQDNLAFARDIRVGDREIPCLVYGQGSELRVFLNSCPHTGVRLEWRPDDFLDASGRYLQCAMHGAQFEPSNGLCVDGPCIEQSLVSIPFEVCGDEVFVVDAEKLPKSARR